MIVDWNQVQRNAILLEPDLQGANSMAYHVNLGSSQYFLKSYKPTHLKRLVREFKSLTVLNSLNVKHIPRVYAVSEENLTLLLSWHDGANPTVIDLNVSRLLTEFVEELTSLSLQDLPLENATDNIMSREDVGLSIKGRMQVASRIEANQIVNSLQRHIVRRAEDYLNSLSKSRVKLGNGFIPSPSDFGTHNLLVESNGDHVFYDFEYFGFDRPEKLLIDTLIHPKNYWTSDSVAAFISFFLKNGYRNGSVSSTFDPYSILNWLFIMLNKLGRLTSDLSSEPYTREQQNSSIVNLRAEMLALVDLYDHVFRDPNNSLGILTSFTSEKLRRKSGESK